MHTKKFTILHSNDMHGNFLAESRGQEGELLGGLALLSGYLNLQDHKVPSTSAQQVLIEYLINHQNCESKVENRLVFS